VQLPGSDGFELTAVAWLLDIVPPEARQSQVLRRYPVALAFLARHHALGTLEGARRSYRTARGELGAEVPPHAVEALLTAYRTEGYRLRDTARAVTAVERALRGEALPQQPR
jgi:hypothetical protein